MPIIECTVPVVRNYRFCEMVRHCVDRQLHLQSWNWIHGQEISKPTPSDSVKEWKFLIVESLETRVSNDRMEYMPSKPTTGTI